MPGPETMRRPDVNDPFMPHASGGGLDKHGGPGVAIGMPDGGEIVKSQSMALEPVHAGNSVDTIDRPALVATPEGGGELAPPDTEQPVASGEPLRFVLTGLDKNVDQFAREAAHEKLSEPHEGGFFKRTAKSIWSNMTREYQVVKATAEAREDILENKNLRHHHGASDEKWREATVKRYASEYGEHLIHAEAGETFHKLGAPEAENDPNAERIRTDTLDLVRKFAKGEVADKDSFEIMQERLFKEWNDEGISQQYIGEGQLLAHNVTEMAEQVKAAIDSRDGLNSLQQDQLLDQLLANAEVVAGEARVGSRAEIDSTLSERVAEKLQGVPFVNEGRLAKVGAAVSNEVVVSAAMSVAAYATKSGFSRAVGTLVVPGLGGSVIAALRERRAMRDERALMERRQDAGFEVEADNTAQQELAEVSYEKRNVNELIGEISNLYDDEGALAITNRAELEAAMEVHGEIMARISIEDQTGKRMISAEGIEVEDMEDKRFDLDLAMAKFEVDVRRLFEDPIAQGMLDIESGESFENWSEEMKDTFTGMLEGEIDEKDKLFNKLTHRRMRARAATTFLVGGTVHEITSELLGLLPGRNGGGNRAVLASASSPSGDGVGEMVTVPDVLPADEGGVTVPDVLPTKNGETVTVPDVLPAKEGTGQTVEVPSRLGTTEMPGDIKGQEWPTGKPYNLSETSKIRLPEGYKVEVNGNVAEVTGPKGELSLPINKDGTLGQEAIQALRERGLNIIDMPGTIEGKPEIVEKDMTPKEFVSHHQDSMLKVDRQGWLGYNTDNVYEKNEQGLHNEVTKNGDIRATIQGMQTVSYENGKVVDPHEAARDGQLFMYISASEGTQSKVFEVPVGPDGNAIIDKDSPAGALFDKEGNFTGGFQEVGFKDPDSPEGTARFYSLATEVGSNQGTITDKVEVPKEMTAHSYVIVSEMSNSTAEEVLLEAEGSGGIFVAPVGRRTLGRGQKATPTPSSTTSASPAPAPTSSTGIATISRSAPVPSSPSSPSPVPSSSPAASESRPKPEQFAQTNGLPSAESSAETPGAEAPSNEEAQTDEERELLSIVDAEDRKFPPGFNVDLSGHNPRAVKMAIMLAHEAIDRDPPQANEDGPTYLRRLSESLKQDGNTGMGHLTTIQPALRAYAREAFEILQNLKLS